MTSSNDALSMMVGLTPMATDNSSADSTAEESMDMDSTDISSDVPVAGPSVPDETENLVYFHDDVDNKELEKQKKLARTLERLQFSNPGDANKMMPARRGRPRKSTEVKKTRTGAFHDKQGRLNIDGQAFPLCDCLNVECHGCFSPCDDCNGRYCGPICQSNRIRYCQKVVTNGKETVYNPFIPESKEEH